MLPGARSRRHRLSRTRLGTRSLPLPHAATAGDLRNRLRRGRSRVSDGVSGVRVRHHTRESMQPRWGWWALHCESQGSSFLAILGFMMVPRRGSSIYPLRGHRRAAAQELPPTLKLRRTCRPPALAASTPMGSRDVGPPTSRRRWRSAPEVHRISAGRRKPPEVAVPDCAPAGAAELMAWAWTMMMANL